MRWRLGPFPFGGVRTLWQREGSLWRGSLGLGEAIFEVTSLRKSCVHAWSGIPKHAVSVPPNITRNSNTAYGVSAPGSLLYALFRPAPCGTVALPPHVTTLCSATADASESGRQVRLVGGPGPWEGVVEVHTDSGWRRVVANRWSESEATVVCRQLGHVRSVVTAETNELRSCSISVCIPINPIESTFVRSKLELAHLELATLSTSL